MKAYFQSFESIHLNQQFESHQPIQFYLHFKSETLLKHLSIKTSLNHETRNDSETSLKELKKCLKSLQIESTV